jgi:hypothetical protein
VTVSEIDESQTEAEAVTVTTVNNGIYELGAVSTETTYDTVDTTYVAFSVDQTVTVYETVTVVVQTEAVAGIVTETVTTYGEYVWCVDDQT